MVKPVALITGGSRGIGLGIAKSLAKCGYTIVICGRREANQLIDVMTQIKVFGVDCLYVQADVSSRDDRILLIERIRNTYGRLDVLVNNAGIAPKVRADLLSATEESFETVLRVNLQGPYFLTQQVANWMIDLKQKVIDFQPSIVNISSISATVASPNRGEYCISKAGISMATKLWATRLAEFGIPVYEVRPGIIATDMTSAVKAKYDQLFEEGLLLEARWGTPEDVGEAVAVLTMGKIPYATGQVLVLDGGLTMPRL
jgi:NAD(P)-dependent dehydrogenase (short-subunit alcohol dehydrogenase family)